MPRLPILLALALCAGVSLSLLVPIDAALACALAVALAVVVVWGVRSRRGGCVLSAALAACCADGAALGAHADRLARQPRLPLLLDQWRTGGAVRLVGTLDEDAAAAVNGIRLRLRVETFEGRAVDGRELAALTVGGNLVDPALSEWRAGRQIRTAATLRRPAIYLDRGVADDRLALSRRGLTLVGSVKSAALVEVSARGGWHQEHAADLRAQVRSAIARHVRPRNPTAGSIATAILIGDRAGLDPGIERRLQIAGTYHVIAISGGNIAVLAAILLAIARLFRIPTPAASLVVALLLIAHAGLVGGGASVARSTAMAVVYLALRAFDQSAWSLNALAAAVLGLMSVRPLAIVDPGFLLSVGATAAIVIAMGRASQRPTHSIWRVARDVMWASLATELVLLPVSATLFNRVTAAGLVLNLAAIPLMALVQVAASIVVLADPLAPGVASASGIVTAAAAQGLVASAALVEWVPSLALRVPAPSIAIGALYLAALSASAMSARRWPLLEGSRRAQRIARAVAVGCALWILASPATWRVPWRADGQLRVVGLDVGQGDATLVEFPNGTRWLIDAGGLAGSSTFDIGERVVAPALWARGTGRLDALILTHGDPDHVGGAGAIVDDFAPAVFDGIPVASHPLLQHVHERARAHRRPWSQLARGDVWDVGGVRVEIKHPPPPDWERPRVRNDDSIVIELRYGGVSVVLPGDIGAEVERTLAADFAPAPFRILKAAHHGSATSTSAEWLEALHARIVLFSCGRENRYGHPAPAVLARVLDRGAKVFRTDEDGEVVVETDGKAMRVTTFTGRGFSTTAKARGREGAKD